jgi:hypothetical protein
MRRERVGELGFAVSEREVLGQHLEQADEDVFRSHTGARSELIGDRLVQLLLQLSAAASSKRDLNDNYSWCAVDPEECRVVDKPFVVVALGNPIASTIAGAPASVNPLLSERLTLIRASGI